jgi:hypothetical protein
MNAASQIQANPAAVSKTANPPPETIEVKDLDQFVQILTGWHKRQVATLEHFLQIPEGTPMQLGEDVEVELRGEVLHGFRAGITLALGLLGELPFAVEAEGEEPAAAAEQPSQASAS